MVLAAYGTGQVKTKVGNILPLTVIKKAMGASALMAFFFCPPLFARNNNTQGTLAFIIIQGDAPFSYVDRSGDQQIVRTDLQLKILEEARQNILKAINTDVILFFDGLNELPFIEIYQKGILIKTETLAEDFTNPSILAAVLTRGYQLFPHNRYFLYHWGYNIPPYPKNNYDLSNPQKTYDVASFVHSLELAGSNDPQKRFEAIVLSTCYNSSLEVLYALHSYTKYLVATEIYLHHDGFSFEFLPAMASESALQAATDIYQKSLAKLENNIPKGPASGKPVMDYSLTVLDTSSFEAFDQSLLNLFSSIQKSAQTEKNIPILKKAFSLSLLKNSRNTPYENGLLDLKSFIDASQEMTSEIDRTSFNQSLSELVLAHAKTENGNDFGINFYFPYGAYDELTRIRPFMIKPLAVFDEFISNYFELFGVNLKKPFPQIFLEFSAYYPEGHIPAQVVKAFLNHEAIIDQFDHKIFQGRLDDQGIFFGRLGSHKLTLTHGQTIHLRHPQNPILLDRMISPDQIQNYSISGQLKFSFGLWTHKQGMVLDVSQIEVTP